MCRLDLSYCLKCLDRRMHVKDFVVSESKFYISKFASKNVFLDILDLVANTVY